MSRPNRLVIMIDPPHGDSPGCCGSRVATAPHIVAAFLPVASFPDLPCHIRRGHEIGGQQPDAIGRRIVRNPGAITMIGDCVGGTRRVLEHDGTAMIQDRVLRQIASGDACLPPTPPV